MTDPHHVPYGHDELVAAFARALAERDPDGVASGMLARSDPTVVEQAVDRLLSTSTAWADLIGPVYDTAGVMSILGVTRQAVSKRRLLALTTGSGRVVYPSFQFTGTGVVDGLVPVLGLLPASLVSPWTLASWFVSPLRELDDCTPIEILVDGDIEPVLRQAQRWASKLAA